MNEQLAQIAARMRELREILDITPEALAQTVGISPQQYNAYENGTDDIPIGVLYAAAHAMGVDPTELLTGEAPRMADYTIVRGGRGVSIQRYAGYAFSDLAYNFIGREMRPMLVTLSQSDAPELVTHDGQEFNYVLEGKLEVTVGGKSFTLEAGDCVYFNPKLPHGQRAQTAVAKFLTVINE